jgi:hypothetical protein
MKRSVIQFDEAGTQLIAADISESTASQALQSLQSWNGATDDVGAAIDAADDAHQSSSELPAGTLPIAIAVDFSEARGGTGLEGVASEPAAFDSHVAASALPGGDEAGSESPAGPIAHHLTAAAESWIATAPAVPLSPASAPWQGAMPSIAPAAPANVGPLPAASAEVENSAHGMVHPPADAISGGSPAAAASAMPETVWQPLNVASLLGSPMIAEGPLANAHVGSGGATAPQVQQALSASGLAVNGSGIKVGVLSDSFNDLGGAAADEASGALPSAANIQGRQRRRPRDDADRARYRARRQPRVLHRLQQRAGFRQRHPAARRRRLQSDLRRRELFRRAVLSERDHRAGHSNSRSRRCDLRYVGR